VAFDLRAGSKDILSSVHRFPGDEHIRPETYRHVIFGGYVSSIATIFGAARGYGLVVGADTFERWKRIGATAGLVDAFLDDSPDPDQARLLYDQGLRLALDADEDPQAPDWADARLEPAVKLLRNSIATLSAETIGALVESARFVSDAVRQKAHCTEVREYVGILKQEAFHSSRLIHGSVADDVRQQTGFAAFTRWCTKAIELGALVDSTWDLWADNKHGRTRVKATLWNSARIAIHAYRPARALSRPWPNRIATLRALFARVRFSLLPTFMAMRRHKAHMSTAPGD
jgi:hypothetical protein